MIFISSSFKHSEDVLYLFIFIIQKQKKKKLEKTKMSGMTLIYTYYGFILLPDSISRSFPIPHRFLQAFVVSEPAYVDVQFWLGPVWLALVLVDSPRRPIVYRSNGLCTNRRWNEASSYWHFSREISMNWYCLLTLPFGYFPCPFAFLWCVIECLAKLATITSWRFTIDAHVEELAVIWIGITRVSGSYIFSHFGAWKIEDLCRHAE